MLKFLRRTLLRQQHSAKNVHWRLLSALFITAFIGFPWFCPAQTRDTGFLKNLLTRADPFLDTLLKHASQYEIMILYTRVDRDAKQRPHFITFSLNYDSLRYFYPASTVKLPTAILSLEKLHALHVKGLDKYTPFKIDSVSGGQRAVTRDTTAAGALPTIAHEIHKVFEVSDNSAYNVLYEFLGQQALNESLHKWGFPSARIIQRLQVGDLPETAKVTNPFTFYAATPPHYTVYRQLGQRAIKTFPMLAYGLKKGKGYMEFHDKDSVHVNAPFDFSDKNFFSLGEQQELMWRLMFPSAFPVSKRFKLTPADYRFLYTNMSMLPRESRHPVYPEKDYPDNYCKYLLFGSEPARLPADVRIFNKIGLAYGYLIDNAFVVDYKVGSEFFLTAVINCNTSGIYNTEKYAYGTLGFPFMKKIGQAILDYERSRKKKIKPDLFGFRCDYSADQDIFPQGKRP